MSAEQDSTGVPAILEFRPEGREAGRNAPAADTRPWSEQNPALYTAAITGGIAATILTLALAIYLWRRWRKI